MKSSLVGMVLATVVALVTGASVQCEAADVCNPRIPSPSAHSCTPRQQVQPVERRVQVTVPMPQPSRPCSPPACPSSPIYCPPPVSATAPARPIPVRVDIAVRPEERGQQHLVPVAYGDPGFLRPIVNHSVRLLGATIAAPFRVAEMLCPLPAQEYPPRQCNGPTSPPPNCGYQQLLTPAYTPMCPVPVARPAARSQRHLTCAPPGPSVAPLPPCVAPSACDPHLPPALVEEYRFPQIEAQNLLSGILNLPLNLIRSGRLTGDMRTILPGAPPAGW